MTEMSAEDMRDASLFASKDKPPLQSNRLTRVKSASGIEAWLVEEHACPLVNVAFGFRGGQTLDAGGKVGAAYLMSAMFSEGAGELPGDLFQTALAEAAIQFNISCVRDRINGTMRVVKHQMARGFELMGLALTAPRFADEALERHRRIAASHASGRMSQPGGVASDAFKERAYLPHAYGYGAQRLFAELPTITRADIANCHARAITRANLCIAVAGAITPAELATLIDATFGALPEGERAIIPPCGFAGAGETVSRSIATRQTSISFGRAGLSVNDPDAASAAVVVHAMGGGFLSRFMVELREKRGLCYGVRLSSDHAIGLDSLIGDISTPNATAAEAMELIKLEIQRLLDGGLTDEEIAASKAFLCGSIKMRPNSSATIADTLLDMQFKERPPTWLDTRLANIAAVSPESVKRVIPRLFGDGSMLFAMAGGPAQDS